MDREQLRALVREVIGEALAEVRRPGAPASAAGTVAEPVRIASDADLDAFVRRIARLMRDPAGAARIESGALRFTLAGAGQGTAGGAALDGLVSERAIDGQPEGATLRLAAGAVVTPLARDRARARRIKLERTR
jgi:hypothetical protein